MTKQRGSRSPTQPPGGVDRHGARVFDEKKHDPYQAAGKVREPAVCEDCRAAYHRGHWQWAPADPGAHPVVCPACRRIREKLPAGTLAIEGPFFLAHRDEILHLVRNEADHERKEHPLNRIMGIEDGPTGCVVATTDIHLPQRIGRALERAYDGELDVRYGEDEYVVRVRWHRG
jgi:hypothetical protein